MDLKLSPLNDEHLELDGRMISFAGFSMPVSYDKTTGGMRKEHLRVRHEAGLFDVSHMGQFFISGPEAADFLSYASSRDLSAAKDGRAIYSLLLNDRGGVVDDVIIYRCQADNFLMIVNASNIDKDFNHLNAIRGTYKVDLSNQSEGWALFALQGPKAAEKLDAALSAISKPLRDLAQMKYYSFSASSDLWITRTGYTGEDGFEVMARPELARKLWKHLIHKEKVWPIGLGARDTLRLEVAFPLYGNELREDLKAHESLAAFAVRNPKNFVGKEALLSPKTSLPIGLIWDSPKPMRSGDKIYRDGVACGQLSSGSFSPCLEKGVGIGQIAWEADSSPPREGELFLLESAGKRREARVTNFPFVETQRVKGK